MQLRKSSVGLMVGMAVLFGAVCVLPNIWQRFDAVYEFQGIEALGADQEHFYAARIREVLDGHWGLGDPFHAEKDLPYLQPPLPEWVMTTVARVFTNSIGHALLLIRFLFGVLLFVAMSLFWFRITDKMLLSVTATSAVLFSWFLFASPWSLMDALSGMPLGVDYARFARLTNPQFSSMLFFFGLFFLVDWHRTMRLASVIVASVFTAVSFYAYPYTWTYLLVVFGLLFLWNLFQKDWLRIKHMVIGAIVIILLGLPFVFHTVHVLEHPAYPSLAERFGLIHSREPVFGAWAALFLILTIAFRKRLQTSVFLIIVAISSMIVLNQQVITGSVVVHHHYHWYFIHPLAVSALIVFFGLLLSRYTKKVDVILSVLVVFFMLWGVRYQWHAYLAQRSLWGDMQKLSGAFAFIDEQERPIVYADDLAGSLVPVFTHADMSFVGAGNVGCLCAPEFIHDSYFLELWLKGVTAEEAEETFPTTERASLSAKLYGLYFREKDGSYESITDERVENAISNYRAFWHLSAKEKLMKAPTDFLIVPTDQKPNPQLQSFLRAGELAYEDEHYQAWDITSIVE